MGLAEAVTILTTLKHTAGMGSRRYDARGGPAKVAGERRLVFVSAGDRHLLHPSLNAGPHFDLVIYFYGESARVRAGLAARATSLVDRKGGKFQNLLAAYRQDPSAFGSYDAVLVMDDDLGLSERAVTRLFDVREEYGLWVAQPAFDRWHRVSFPYSRSSPRTKLRWTNFVEMSAPVFRRDKLQCFLDTYDGSLYGWGVDYWYMNVLGTDWQRRYAVIDEVTCSNPLQRGPGGPGREIDRLASTEERRGSWEETMARHHLSQYSPMARGGVARSLPGQVTAALGVVASGVAAARKNPRARREMLARAKSSSRKLTRDAVAGATVRRFRRVALDRGAIERVSEAWGRWSRRASVDFVVQCVDAAEGADGPVLVLGAGLSAGVLALALNRVGRSVLVITHVREEQVRLRRRLLLAGLRGTAVVVCPLITRNGEGKYDYEVATVDLPHGIGLLVASGRETPVALSETRLRQVLGDCLDDSCLLLVEAAEEDGAVPPVLNVA